MKAIGCDAVLIGHCEERRDKLSIIAEGKGTDAAAVNRILNKEIKAAIAAGLDVLYCIGENADEQPRWQEVLKEQLTVGLEGVDKSKVTIAYEPVWAIGTWQDSAGCRLYPEDCFLCQGSDRWHGCCLWRRLKDRQCEDACIRQRD